MSFVYAVGSTRREGGVPAYINLSASSMLMIAMQYTSNPGVYASTVAFVQHRVVNGPEYVSYSNSCTKTFIMSVL